MPWVKPTQNRVVVINEAGKAASLETRDVPSAGPGSAVLCVMAVSVRANSPNIYRNPDSGHSLPFPVVPGFAAIGRVVDAGPDATKLKSEQLFFFDPYIQGRDRGGIYISGMMEGLGEGNLKLSRGEWRDSTYVDYFKAPLENCHPLDEARLLGGTSHGGLGYTLNDLTHLSSMLVPFGGIADIDVKSGDTIIIAPATGRYGSAAVHLALAMGAHVIAIGRNGEVLSQLAFINPRISTVKVTNDVEQDVESLGKACRGSADAFWDMYPSAAESTTHFKSCLTVLRHSARLILMGSISSGIDFSYLDILSRGLTIRGTWMCTPEQTRRLIKMAETGVLPLGDRAGMGPVQLFGLENWEQAWDAAARRTEPGEVVVSP